MSLRVVFAGTPEFAVPCLDALLAGPVPPVAVLTQPDRPAGRGRQPQASPVKQRAEQAGVPVYQPLTLRDVNVRRQLSELRPDLLIVVAYGLLLPPKVLEIPRHGCWNVHASLLPRWRGAAPIQRAVEAGDRETGVCLMRMERGLDTGPVFLRLRTPIAADETAGSLHDRLAVLGAEVLRDGIGLLRAGLLPQPVAQPEEGVTHARKLDKSEARLDWSLSAEALARKVRAFSPWPVAELLLGAERVRVHAADAVAGQGAPGELLRAAQGVIEVACGEGALRLHRLQREGGRVISAADYLNARRDWAGGG